jgi:hypothetical protein
MDWKTVHRANFMGTRMIVDRRQGILRSLPICTVEISRADFKPLDRHSKDHLHRRSNIYPCAILMNEGNNRIIRNDRMTFAKFICVPVIGGESFSDIFK